MPKKPSCEKKIESFTHDEASRVNIPPVEYQTMMRNQETKSLQIAYEQRNPDLDPQLIWRGKDFLDDSPLVVNAPPLYIQEKVHPKTLIDDLKRQSEKDTKESEQIDLFAAFNGLPSDDAKTEFYQHTQNWSNRMILGDSIQVMASLAEREGLRGKVQCIYFDPPYGIKFNSNFQWSTSRRDVKDGKQSDITREPEQVKAFRDTWKDGVNSYLSYIRDRLIVGKELLAESGSIFIQIGDDNVHRLRAVCDEVFGDQNFVAQITVVKTSGLAAANRMPTSTDYILWYAKSQDHIKFRPIYKEKDINSNEGINYRYLRDEAGFVSTRKRSDDPDPSKAYRIVPLTKPGPGAKYPIEFQGKIYQPGNRWWGTTKENMERVIKSGRITKTGNSIGFLRAWSDRPITPIDNVWTDTGTGGFLEQKIYVVQTIQKIVQRCILMSTDPGDLVLDPTCGSGTTAYVSEQWGRRWISIDTSRVALALARSRIMGGKFPYFYLADSEEGARKQATTITPTTSSERYNNNISFGFVYKRAPHITLKLIANNKQIDEIWEQHSHAINEIVNSLNIELNSSLQEFSIPRIPDPEWPPKAKEIHENWMKALSKRQEAIDKSIKSLSGSDPIFDQPYEDTSKIRVSGPFTVESLSPHRTATIDESDVALGTKNPVIKTEGEADFDQMILETLRKAGVQQPQKNAKINFESIAGWPGSFIAAKGHYKDLDGEIKSAGIFIGPEFGTVSRVHLVEAARECADAGFDVLISCAFNYDAISTEFDKLGPLPILKARMNTDLHMQNNLENTGAGNLFVIFGEPDIDIIDTANNKIQVKIHGIDIYDPSTAEVRSDEPDSIACWFIDSDYNGESFFVRQAYFLGQDDPYKSLKTSLKSDIDLEAWNSLNSDTSIPFVKPSTGRIAVKVINHLGDEVMKIYRVP